MARARYDQSSRPNVLVTPTANGVEFLPVAGIDNGDGTASVSVSGGGGGGGGGSSAQTSITTLQTTIVSLAAAVQVSSASPVATRFLVNALVIGGGTVYFGPAGVNASTGYPVTAGNTFSAPLGSPVPLYAYSPTGSAVAIVEYA